MSRGTDVFDATKRSWLMSRVRQKNTAPELLVRAIIHRLGFRFTVDGPRNKMLPGRPDIVLPRHRTVVLVHGCFWHAHTGCYLFKVPKQRTNWWIQKFADNRARDRSVRQKLKALGWAVVTVWGCELKNQIRIQRLEKKMIRLLSQNGPPVPEESGKRKDPSRRASVSAGR
jgi:DNA mismatch endonuclease, patch repair protein